MRRATRRTQSRTSLSAQSRPVVQCGDDRLVNRRRFQSRGHAIRVFPRVSQAPFAECHDVTTARLGVVDVIALNEVSAAQTNGIQPFDQVQIGACLLDLLAKVGGAGIGLLQDAARFIEATLFL